MKKFCLFFSVLLVLFYSSLSNAAGSVGMYRVSAYTSNAQMQADAVAWPGVVAAVGAAVVATVSAAYGAGYALGQFAYNIANGFEQRQIAYHEGQPKGLDNDFTKFDI